MIEMKEKKVVKIPKKMLIKNIEKAKVLTLADELPYSDGQIISKTLAQNSAVSITLFSFEKGEEISTHESGGEIGRAHV